MCDSDAGTKRFAGTTAYGGGHPRIDFRHRHHCREHSDRVAALDVLPGVFPRNRGSSALPTLDFAVTPSPRNSGPRRVARSTLGVSHAVILRLRVLPFQPRRWLVERTFGFLMQARRLACRLRTKPSSSHALIPRFARERTVPIPQWTVNRLALLRRMHAEPDFSSGRSARYVEFGRGFGGFAQANKRHWRCSHTKCLHLVRRHPKVNRGTKVLIAPKTCRVPARPCGLVLWMRWHAFRFRYSMYRC